ncbi:FecR family protein [Chitinophaga sp. RCC_12]|uniref:FecR family protein n=1 Tax=Chitinophaga sp. RCC_12 TaxID=3239226 RepID=UPI00352488BD
MNKKKAKAFLDKYEKGELSAEEQLRLNQWYLSASAASKDSLSDEQLKESYDFLKARLPLKSYTKTRRIWPRITAVAAAIGGILIGVWFFNSHTALREQVQNETRYRNDIAPGKATATLTFANGKAITLSSSKTGIVVGDSLTYNDHTAVAPGADPSSRANAADLRSLRAVEMTLSTPRGGTYQVTLSDGTKVWLNAASGLTYTGNLNELRQRRVKLEGEAYFEVAKDKARPFIVESRGQELEVLGTHFNIKAYKDEPTVETTLLEGSVDIYATEAHHAQKTSSRYRLKPNQYAVLNNDKMKITDVDPEAMVAWKSGYFQFNHESIQSIMQKLSRWYDIEVSYESGLPEEKFTGRISRSKHINQVLQLMEAGQSIKFKVEGRRVIVIR